MKGRWQATVLALAGLVVAAALGFGVSQLVGQDIGLAGEPLSAGEQLAPPATSPRTTPTTRTTTTPRRTRTTAPTPTTTTTTTTTDDDTSGSDDGGGGRGRGRGRGRGGDDDD